MEILQNLWNVLVTEDENLTKYVCLLLTLIETYVTMKLFTSILNISYTKKQRNIYFICLNTLMILSTIFLPREFFVFINFIITPLLIKFIFKTTIFKSIFAEVITMIVIVLLETIILKISLVFFGIPSDKFVSIIIYRIPCMLLIYSIIFITSKLIDFTKIKLNMYENLDNYYKRLFIINLIFILITVALQFYLLIFYNNALPIYITLISLISLIIYSFISIYSMMKTINLEITKRELEQSKLHNKTLELLYSNTSAFKHDFSNIITALGGYIYAKDMNGLEKYYKKILDECHINNNLSTLNPVIINNPAVYNILATNYYKADELGINISLEVFLNLNELKLNIYEFSRILGILLDNAVEASAKCEDKKIFIRMQDIKPQKCQILTIENTYSNKNIDINKLSTKGYTSKENDKESHGIGLWQISRILKKYNNAVLITSKNDQYFKQELEIYY